MSRSACLARGKVEISESALGFSVTVLYQAALPLLISVVVIVVLGEVSLVERGDTAPKGKLWSHTSFG